MASQLINYENYEKNQADVHVTFISLPSNLKAKYIITVNHFTMQSEICMCWGPESVDPGFLHSVIGVIWVPWRSCICTWYKSLLTLMKITLLPIPTKYASHTSRPNGKKWPSINKVHQGAWWPRGGMIQGAVMGQMATGRRIWQILHNSSYCSPHQ